MSANLSRTIKRSRAAELLDKTPRTLARYEEQGILTPIKLNCRSVVYSEAQVRKLLAGEVQAGPDHSQSLAVSRTKQGTFSPAAAGSPARVTPKTPKRTHKQKCRASFP